MDCLNISSCTDLLRPMSRLSISLQIAAKTASIILEGRKFLGVNFLPYKMKTEKDEEMEDLVQVIGQVGLVPVCRAVLNSNELVLVR